eukprot:CAMPEP_0204069732 /NCGR_PEP_ID=MMETSP0360-20130528/157365_1 /ASSEMBLY_ACC=CAM_ASM_000342 /TAXON_ID=268821 /ORGANISM="Scrippsiella Hangoei, Strain SHTV-5" /LENGTH=142 /DNA_ID=CAMNT_0051017909 /DNA_START=140 /DNA_END=567 /DNA_ORIENTATION=-
MSAKPPDKTAFSPIGDSGVDALASGAGGRSVSMLQVHVRAQRLDSWGGGGDALVVGGTQGEAQIIDRQKHLCPDVVGRHGCARQACDGCTPAGRDDAVSINSPRLQEVRDGIRSAAALLCIHPPPLVICNTGAANVRVDLRG